jgi:DNA-binding XRE family transcriptional regulator
MNSTKKLPKKLLSKMLWRARNPLRSWRLSHDMTQADLSSLIGASAHTVAAWEQGSIRPGSANMSALAYEMDWNVNELITAWDHWRKGRK